MTKRRIDIEDLHTTESKNKVVEMQVSYDMGGMNYFTGTVEPRGYYLSATPCEKAPGIKVYGAFTGIKIIILTATRFNQKKLEELASNIKDHEQYNDLIENVLTKNNLTLQSPVTEPVAA
jgi:hypothetical protein